MRQAVAVACWLPVKHGLNIPCVPTNVCPASTSAQPEGTVLYSVQVRNAHSASRTYSNVFRIITCTGCAAISIHSLVGNYMVVGPRYGVNGKVVDDEVDNPDSRSR